ncbi:MAG: hypothetical protein HQK72_11445 [Desulfamplus sp.]|nr:hypothetical protein [Desulfamplus sp.]
MDKQEKKHPPMELHLNSNLSTNWIDNINIGVRDDNLLLIRFLTNLPEGIFEQYRLMTSKEHLKHFIDILCSSIHYYPTNNKD